MKFIKFVKDEFAFFKKLEDFSGEKGKGDGISCIVEFADGSDFNVNANVNDLIKELQHYAIEPSQNQLLTIELV